MSNALRQTPLHAWHAAHGARLVDFAGWSMPVQYASIVAEHQATRTGAGLFDISHMGRLVFPNLAALAPLDCLLTRRVVDLAPGRIRYSLVTKDDGGILDDVLAYHVPAGAAQSAHPLLVVNASNREKIVAWIGARSSPGELQLTDQTSATAMLAVQGPKALELLQPVVSVPLPPMKYYTCASAQVLGHPALVSRTGYTGEDGAELIVAAAAAEPIWQKLVEAGATPAGLGCRDTLRLEAAMPLYGHELDEATDPFTAGLGMAVDLEGREFIGSAALAKCKNDPSLKRRVGLELDGRRVPREGFTILHQGKAIGRVTSGTFSPTLDRPIAMGYVEHANAAVGTAVEIDVRGRAEPARVVALPFYRRAKTT